MCTATTTANDCESIPDYKRKLYQCKDKGNPNYTCINLEKDTPVEMIAHTIQGEGGNYTPELAANIFQTILNRAYTYWVYTHHAGINPNNIPWEKMTKETLTCLILFILSEDSGERAPELQCLGIS